MSASQLTPRSSAQLEVQALADGAIHTLVLSGELDIASGPELDRTINQLLLNGSTALVIDLRKLRFIDSTGIKSVLEASRLCEEHGQEFRLIPGPKNVQRIFQVTGLDRTLPFVGSSTP